MTVVILFSLVLAFTMSVIVFLSCCHVTSIMIRTSKTYFHSVTQGLSCVLKLLP